MSDRAREDMWRAIRHAAGGLAPAPIYRAVIEGLAASVSDKMVEAALAQSLAMSGPPDQYWPRIIAAAIRAGGEP